jgi:hypothetical protein
MGKKPELTGHHGLGNYWDIRFVAPTTADRLEMLDLVRGIVEGNGTGPLVRDGAAADK